jgi:hypothetical protein
MAKKLLFALRGETYRSGPQMSRNRGDGDYIKRQHVASKSHINFVKYIKTKFDIDTDILIDAVRLNETDDLKLLNYYKTNLSVLEHHFDSPNPTEIESFYKIFNKITRILNNNSYDYIIITRFDLYLKDALINQFVFNSNKIVFPFIDSHLYIDNSYRGLIGELKLKHNGSQLDYNFFSQTPVLLVFPQKYFYLIQQNRITELRDAHDLFNKFIDNNVPLDDIGYMINTLHVSSSDLGWNPLWIQVGRYDNTEYNNTLNCQATVEYYYCDKTHSFIHDPEKTTEYYKPFLNTDTLDKQLSLITNDEFVD